MGREAARESPLLFLLLCASVSLWFPFLLSSRFARVLDATHARALGLDQHRHVSGLVLVLHHLGVGAGNVRPTEDLGHAGIDAPFDHQLIGLTRLEEIGEMAALDALLAHPDETGV